MVILSLLDNRAEGLILHVLPCVPSEDHWKVSVCPKLGVGRWDQPFFCRWPEEAVCLQFKVPAGAKIQ